jgi:CheY-like chemotaxis protein
MEVGAQSGTHFQLARRGGTPSPITWRNPMKPRLILLFTPDRTFHQLVREAFLGIGAIVFIARNVADALQIVCQRGRELDFALLDLDGGCRGMTLLSAVHTCFEQLPILVTTSKDAEHATRRRSVSSLVEIWIDEEFAKNGGRQPESVEVLPI